MQNIGDKVVAIRVTEALGDRLAALAARENNRVSAVTRRLITQALDLEDAARASRRAPRHRSA